MPPESPLEDLAEKLSPSFDDASCARRAAPETSDAARLLAEKLSPTVDAARRAAPALSDQLPEAPIDEIGHGSSPASSDPSPFHEIGRGTTFTSASVKTAGRATRMTLGRGATFDSELPSGTSVLGKTRRTTEGVHMDEIRITEMDTELRDVLGGSFALQGEGKRRRWIRKKMNSVSKSPRFRALSSLAIFLNTIWTAFSTEYGSEHPLEGTPAWHEAVDASFTIFYTIELAINFIAQLKKFFTGSDYGWNIFDVILVVTALPDTMALFFGTATIGNYSYLRAARLTRLFKMFRIFKLMRQFRELRLLLISILGSLRSLAWTGVLMFSLLYIFGIAFVQAATSVNSEWMRSGQYLQPGQPEELLIVQHWGHLGRAMNSLYVCSTSGDDWTRYAYNLYDAGSHYYAFFCFYICFFMVVILNSVTSVFVDSVRNYSTEDQAMQIETNLSNKEEHMRKLVALFTIMDADGSGEVSYEEFTKNMADPRIVAFADGIDLTVNDLDTFFNIISRHGRQGVDIETFVDGCMRIKGMARAMDVVDVMTTARKTEERVNALMLFCAQHFGAPCAKHFGTSMTPNDIVQNYRLHMYGGTCTREFSTQGTPLSPRSPKLAL